MFYGQRQCPVYDLPTDAVCCRSSRCGDNNWQCSVFVLAHHLMYDINYTTLASATLQTVVILTITQDFNQVKQNSRHIT